MCIASVPGASLGDYEEEGGEDESGEEMKREENGEAADGSKEEEEVDPDSLVSKMVSFKFSALGLLCTSALTYCINLYSGSRGIFSITAKMGHQTVHHTF